MEVVTAVPFVRKKNHREPALRYADARIEAWAKWVKEHQEHFGLPRQSALYQAVMMTKVGVIFERIEELSKHTALGRESRTFHYKGVEIPEPIAEVDSVVSRQPEPLKKVISANYFVYGPIEVRAKASGYTQSRFTQLLEAAKYAVSSGLQRSWTDESEF